MVDMSKVREILGSKVVISGNIDPIEVRMRIGMVFQKPNPFPKSIYDNVAYGLHIRGVKRRSIIEKRAFIFNFILIFQKWPIRPCPEIIEKSAYYNHLFLTFPEEQIQTYQS